MDNTKTEHNVIDCYIIPNSLDILWLIINIEKHFN